MKTYKGTETHKENICHRDAERHRDFSPLPLYKTKI